MKRYIKSTSENGREDAELLATDGSWELWTPHTFEASIYLARKGADRDHWARWDTAYIGNGSRYFDHFTKKGPLYVFINKADPADKYQYHAETNSFYNWNDRPADFESFICEHPAFAEFFGIDCDDVEACDKVTASTKPHPPIPVGWERVPEGDDDEGNWTTISKELPNNGGYIWLDLLYDDNDRRYYELQIGYRNSDGTIGDIHPLISKEFYRLGDAVDYAEDRINRESNSEEDIESCDTVTASEICYRDRDNDNRVVALDAGMSDEQVEAMLAAHPSYYRSTLDEIDSTFDTKYFANMVNCSSDPELDDDFLIEGYYDSQYRGLAESAETSDISALNELAWEYANKGYYFRLHNLSDGTIFEFAPDNWINDIAPDGGVELFMSW